ncbi:MAG: hypothetical protein ACLVAW_27295 [Eisenbergiella massiliensis]
MRASDYFIDNMNEKAVLIQVVGTAHRPIPGAFDLKKPSMAGWPFTLYLRLQKER